MQVFDGRWKRFTSSAVFSWASRFDLRGHKQDGAFGDDTGRQDDNKCQQVGHYLEDFDCRLDNLLIGKRTTHIFRW